MAVGDNYRRIQLDDQLIFDSTGALVGVRSGRSTATEMRTLTAAQLAYTSTMVTAYTWATRPAAASNTGQIIRVTDYGTGGSLWYSDGSNWRPQGGSQTLWRRVGSVATPLSIITGNGAAQSFTLADATTIPAGMLIPGISSVQVIAKVRRSGAAGASSSVVARLGNSGALGIADNSMAAQTVAATTLLDTLIDCVADISTTTSFLNTGFLARNGGPNSSSFADRTTNFDCSGSNTNLVSIGVPSTFTVDQMHLLSYEVILRG